MEPTHLSLFTGIGGIDLAAEWAGFRTVGQCEINPYCLKVLEKNFPNVKRWNDVKQLTGKEIIKTVGTPTLISGGFPCQPHSAAGKRKASCDDRDLWPEIRRILGEVKPRWFVGENVSGLRSSEKGIFFGKILNDLDSLGYNVAWGSWEAGHLNAPHHRERLFIVAHSVNNNHRPEPGTLPEAGGLPENNRKAMDTGLPLGTNCHAEHNAQDPLCERGGGGCNGNKTWCECPLQTPGSDCHASHGNNNGSGASGYGSDGRREACCQERGREPFDKPCRQDTVASNAQPREHSQCVHVSRDGWFEEHIEEQWRDPWYEVASKFCRVDDGISCELDKGVINDNECNTKGESTDDIIRREVLQKMWRDATSATASSFRKERRCLDTLSEMPHFYTYEIRDMGKRIKENKELCDMWCSLLSHPFKKEHHLLETMLIRIRETECVQAMEEKRRDRIKRLQCLGNAVVPQQVYPLLKEIYDYEILQS